MAEQVFKYSDFSGFVLDPGTVLNAIIAQVLSVSSGQVVLLSRLGFLILLRGLPSWFQIVGRTGIANEFATADGVS